MDNIIRELKVCEFTGLSRSSLRRLIASGEFPKPIKIGKSAIGWFESDLTRWSEDRRAARDAASKSVETD